LTAFDTEHVWHPYEPMPAVRAPIAVDAAQGVQLHFADGRTVIDGMSSWWAAIHGYRHPMLDRAARGQLDRMAHVMFGGLTHEPAVQLAEQLLAMTPDPLRRVFFSDSGSVAVEVAIKLALQYWQGRGQPQRSRLLTVRGGYHGDTLGAMSVCDPVDGMHRLFAGMLAGQVFAPRPPAGYDAPPDEGYLAELRKLAAEHAPEIAAVIVEPVVQGAGGMRFYSPAYLRALRELCDEHELLLILDEIATGFGRTGRLFGCDHAGVVPEIMCLGKALTGGYLTLAATLCTAEVAATVSAPGAGGAFMHGPTYMANPLACAVAAANLQLLQAGDWPEQVRRIQGILTTGLEPARQLPQVADVRVLGAIGVVETIAPLDVAAATAAALEAGVWLRPFRNLVYTMPPYICSPEQTAAIAAAVVAAARAGTA
jgi:adenosylmethionine-8-amino-7-oxononanoate aminotransferase